MVTQNEVAEARLQIILNKKLKAIRRWKDIPYYIEDTTTLRNPYLRYSHPAYTFRNPVNRKTGELNICGAIFRHIVAFPGESPTRIKRSLGFKEKSYGDLFQCLRIWKLAISIKGKYYPTNTGIRYFKHFFADSVFDVIPGDYYDFSEGHVVAFHKINKIGDVTKDVLKSIKVKIVDEESVPEVKARPFEEELKFQVENAKTFDDLLTLKTLLTDALNTINQRGKNFISEWNNLGW